MGLAMPNLNLMMSIGTFLLLIFWFIDPGFKAGVENLKKNKIAILLIGIIVIHLVWLLNTENLDYAFKDIRIKAPLIVFGLVLGSVNFSREQLKLFFLSLSAGIWLACGVAYYNYFQSDVSVFDHRDIVTGISHIRLSLLMVALVIGIVNFWRSLSIAWKIYCALVFLNVILFFQILQSLTGLISLGIVLVFSFLVFLFRRYGRPALLISLLGIIAIATVGVVVLNSVYRSYFSPVEELSELPAQTLNGNAYYHQKEVRLVENGHYIFMNICEPEMVRAWNKRSVQKLRVGEESSPLRDRLVRYLTSKGLKKDSLGVMQLSDKDIENIEMGFPAVIYTVKSGLPLRIHSFLFAYHVYSNTGYASGYSFFQRMVYWKAALDIIEGNFLVGVGTGDVKDAFQEVYRSGKYNLDEKYWLRAHNQFLTFFVAFGVFGLAYFIFFFAEAFRLSSKSYLASAIVLLTFLSCLTEDTLETQAGVAFFGFFISLFSRAEDS
jgi:O-antigen ligase